MAAPDLYWLRECRRRWDEYIAVPFPDVRGREVEGIDLVLLDADTAGHVETVLGSRGVVRVHGVRDGLHGCIQDLRTVIANLDGDVADYFVRLLELAELVEDGLSSGR